MASQKAILLSLAVVSSSLSLALGGSGNGFMRRTSQVIEAKGSLMMAQLPMDAPSETLTVKLTRVDAQRNADAEGGFYMGHMSFGKPSQNMSMLFHTSSGHVVVPHVACENTACLNHKRYSPWSSKSAMDVQLNGEPVSVGHRLAHSDSQGNVKRQVVMLDYADSELGSGEARSIVVRDHICMNSVTGEEGCVDLEILAATSLPDHPFKDMPTDGIVGLGLESLSASPLCSFFGRFVAGSKNMLPQFGVSYGPTDGEILFGGHDESLYVSPLRWLDVASPQDGFWQVKIHAVRIGSKVVDDCAKGCNAVVDTGAAHMGVKDADLESFKAQLASHIEDNEGCIGPELIFDMGDFTLSLPPNDYTDSECVPELGPLKMEETVLDGVYAFGAPMLRHYYASFDWDSKRIGFARSTKAPAPKHKLGEAKKLRR